MDPTSMFYSFFVFMWLTFLWEQYLSIRQYRIRAETKEPTDDVLGVMDKESFYKSRAYTLDKQKFHFVHAIWEIIESSMTLLFNLIPIFWTISGHLRERLGFDQEAEIIQSAIFLVMGSLISTILSVPWQVYNTFVIEERHGFNKQTGAFFIKDQIKKFILSLVIGLPITGVVIAIIRAGGDHFFIYVWLALSVITLFLMTIYPEFIAPLFDKYNPLPDGDLRSKIEALAAKLSYPLTKLYVVEGSKRSAHSNAYLYGFWKNKRIVLFDTLLENYTPLNENENDEKVIDTAANNGEENKTEEEKTELSKSNENQSKEKKQTGCNDDEVVAVIGHELGHWKLSHNLTNLVISEANLFLCLFVFAVLHQRKDIYEAFGFSDTQPTLIGLLIIFQFVFAPYDQVLSFLMTCLTRRLEFQADDFAAKLGYSDKLSSALVKLGKDNLTFPVDDWLFSMWHHSHPPVLERTAALKKYQ